MRQLKLFYSAKIIEKTLFKNELEFYRVLSIFKRVQNIKIVYGKQFTVRK